MLNQRHAGYLNYFERLATQPPNRWDGFYLVENQQESIFGLRFQIAFACYALGALCLYPDSEEEEKERCHHAMVALIERMLQRRVWAYWAKSAERRGTSPDPVERANGDYSAHLAMMIGVLEVACGDYRYDEPFNLLWTSTERFTYTHHSLVEALWQQMRKNKHHGIDNEPGRTYATTMCAVLWANLLHDWLHGSKYAGINAEWLAFLQRRMVLRGPRVLNGGTFSPFYRTRLGLSAPTSTNLVDAWMLAMLAPIAPDLTRKFAPHFLQTIRDKDEAATGTMRYAHVPPDSPLFARQETDHTLPNGFGYVLAIELGEQALATALLRHADREFLPVELEQTRYYTSGVATPYTTALFALGEACGLQPFVRTEQASATPADGDAAEGPQPFTEDDEYAVLLSSEPAEGELADDGAPGWAGPTVPAPLFPHTEQQPEQSPTAAEQPRDEQLHQEAPDDGGTESDTEQDAIDSNTQQDTEQDSERIEPEPVLSTGGGADNDAANEHDQDTETQLSSQTGATEPDEPPQPQDGQSDQERPLSDGTLREEQTQPDDKKQEPIASVTQQPEKRDPPSKSKRKRAGSRKKKSTDTSE